MFSADLSWSDGRTEKVGERRERKAKERASVSPSCTTSSASTTSSGSISAKRELWWTSGLKKARGIKSSATLRSSSHNSKSLKAPSVQFSSPPSISTWDSTLPSHTRNTSIQSDPKPSNPLSPTSTSRASLDFTEYDIPELDGDMSSRYTNSTESYSLRERPWEQTMSHQVEVVSEANQLQGHSPTSNTSRGTSSGSDFTQRRDFAVAAPDALIVKKDKRRPCPVRIEGRPSQEYYIHEATTIEAVKHSGSDAKMVACRPLSQWDSLSPRGIPTSIRISPTSTAAKAVANRNRNRNRNVSHENTRFGRFLHRMENAGPKIVLDRLKETWQNPPGEDADEDMLENQLWLLTGLQLQNLGKMRMLPKPICDTGRTLELYGNLSEVYQSSAMHPHQTVHFLTTKPQRKIPLPGNVSYLTAREFGTVPLPYPEEYFSHVRASTLPSLVPSAKLPELFRECYKLLAPGGLLEVRIMNAAPMRNTAGPKMKTWVEDRLSTNLERLFRCSKPCLLVPGWLEEAGFEPGPSAYDTHMRLPCAYDESASDVNEELSMTIGRALWKDVWGSFVDEVPGELRWWWEDEEIVAECLERQTVLECQTLFACKR